MSTNTVPRFIEQPRVWGIPVSQVNAAVDGSGTFDELVLAPSDGLRIDLITLRAAEGVIANTVRLFLQTPGNTAMLWEEVLVSATTLPGENAEAWNTELTLTVPLNLASGWSLQVAVATADTINVFAHGGLY